DRSPRQPVDRREAVQQRRRASRGRVRAKEPGGRTAWRNLVRKDSGRRPEGPVAVPGGSTGGRGGGYAAAMGGVARESWRGKGLLTLGPNMRQCLHTLSLEDTS